MEHTEGRALELMKKLKNEQHIFYDFARHCSEHDKLFQRRVDKLVYLYQDIPINSIEDDLKINELMRAMDGLIEERLLVLMKRSSLLDDLMQETDLTREEFEIIDRYQESPFYWTTRKPALIEEEKEEDENES